MTGRINHFLGYKQNQAIKEAIEPLVEEFKKIGVNGLTQAIGENNKDVSTIFAELFRSHFKQTAIAKWTRNMLSQGTKLWAKNKASQLGVEIPKEVQEQLGMNFNYKNYKTLINTGLVTSVPILGTIFAIPYAFNAWLTNIQKKAGKIGIMKAMDKIDDPRIFATETPQSSSNETKEPQVVAKNTNTKLLDKFKQQAV